MNPKSETKTSMPQRSEYAKPDLVNYGSVIRLTQTAGTGFADNNQKNCNHSRPNTNPNCGSLG